MLIQEARCDVKLSAVILLVVLTTAGAKAGDTNLERTTLRGIAGVRVLVELSGDAKHGPTKEQVQTDVELRLRKAGANVVSEGTTYLRVTADIMEALAPADGVYAFDCEVSVHQGVVVALNGIAGILPTWSSGYLGVVGRNNMERSVRDALGDLVDRFLNAYLDANPKR
jgi:hypothetical protein